MNIICHAFPAWEGNYVKSTVELMKCVALRHRVLYVDYAYTWTDVFKSMMGKSAASWRRILGLETRLRAVDLPSGASLHVLTLPPMLPVNFLKNPRLYDAVNRINGWLVRSSIQHAQRQINMKVPVIVNAFNPGFGLQVAGHLNESRLIYYCYDEISAAQWAGKHGARLERDFSKKCDAIAVTSEGLLRNKLSLHPHLYLVKNGVDIDLFSRPITATDLPEIPDLKAGQKVIGYLGSVDDRLDFDLLERLFATQAHSQLVFVGRVQSEAIRQRLSRHPNVLLAGAFPPEALPGWVQRMDVCLIPFVKNQFTAGIYPLKVNEYLACGKPVVSTQFADLGDFEQIISIADNGEDFIELVNQALVPAPKAESDRRRAFATANSWSARAMDLERFF